MTIGMTCLTKEKHLVISLLNNLNTKSIFKICSFRLGLAAHTCNPSYSRGRDWEDRGSGTNPGQKVCRDFISTIKIWMWWCMPAILACGKHK
jgi:hypothetical protein